MKIKCINDIIRQEFCGKDLVEWAKYSDLEITSGKTYTVIAISKYFNEIFFYIIGDETANYPLAFPSVLFQITDNSISKYWDNAFKFKSINELSINNGEIISFKEWTLNGDDFYEKVLDEIEPEISIFREYRDKMLNE